MLEITVCSKNNVRPVCQRPLKDKYAEWDIHPVQEDLWASSSADAGAN